MERTIWNLENRELKLLTEEHSPEVHFLDMRPEDQQVLRSFLTEKSEEAAEIYLSLEEPAYEQLGKSALTQLPDSAKRKKHIKKLKGEYKHYFPLINFTPIVLERVTELEHLRNAFISQFSAMNRGSLADKHHVPNTDPKLFEREAGKDGRVYYRRTSGTHSVHIELIGTKATQSSDYARLKRLTGN